MKPIHYVDRGERSYTACSMKVTRRLRTVRAPEPVTCKGCKQRLNCSLQCKWCDATIPNDLDTTFAKYGWGWTLAPDPGLGYDAHGPVPGWWYACPEHSDLDRIDAWSYLRPHNAPVPDAVKTRQAEKAAHDRSTADYERRLGEEAATDHHSGV